VEREIASVASDALSTTEYVAYFAGSVPYVIESRRYLDWQILVREVESFLETSLTEAEFAITRILSGAAPISLLGSGGPVDSYRDEVELLSSIQEHVVPVERNVENALRMLEEQGFDRALDLLTSLQISEFFEMHPDGSSYATHLEREASTVTRQVAPESRITNSLLGSPEVRVLSRRRR
jgi:hypothetical protein